MIYSLKCRLINLIARSFSADTVNSASESKCSRDTGFWTPPFLSPCLQIVAFSQAKVEQTYDLTSWTDTDDKYEVYFGKVFVICIIYSAGDFFE